MNICPYLESKSILEMLMNQKLRITFILVLCVLACIGFKNENMKKVSEYRVVKLEKPMPIDGNWDKMEWQKVEAIQLEHFMGEAPKFRPIVNAKMMYDANNLYVIFQVADRYIRCVTNKTNGPVYEDTCVEFFFSPDQNSQLQYFNLETNCGGTALMYYNLIPRKDYIVMDTDDIQKIEIAHSMPEIVDPEITKSVIWTLEYKLPLELLKKYATVSQPAPGVVWKGNCYKIADKTSNPHYLTWSLIDQIEPDFHLPQFFGTLIFN